MLLGTYLPPLILYLVEIHAYLNTYMTVAAKIVPF